MQQKKRFVRGINTDVWIGRKFFNNDRFLFEWYFMADNWDSSTAKESNRKDPVLLIVYFPGNVFN